MRPDSFRRSMNSSGMTIVEALAAIVICTICLTAFLQLFLSGRTHRSEIDRSVALKELLSENVIELKSRPITEVPAAGKCLVRTYSLRHEFLKESVVDAGPDGPCKTDDLDPEQIEVVWWVRPSTAVEATFSSPALKLPTLSEGLKMVTLSARGYAGGGRGNQIINRVTVFKR